MTNASSDAERTAKVLLCVGNSMMGDDGAGPLLAQQLADRPIYGWQVVDGGSAPETETVHIRELAPKLLVVVDATEMGLNPGEIRLVDPDSIGEMMLMSTHSMPLNYLIDDLRDAVDEVVMIGIQPDIVGFCYPMTPPVSQAVAALYQKLADDEWRQIPQLTAEGERC
ncbi:MULTISPECIES: hydrogenase maturation peptidase HycI [Shewanella]|jgi:hydrogenase 3 maturation protease|uniref:Hydrogenase maturation peptidase HycI n=1 Tax=Shewanella dokdonensis TaxID=712036 RepID=A0ABX8DGH3_9GAMM|nr:hydrogenase maturation peptidase HycI [Shewanella dokdonensis]MCL1074098.1 hydrogenase maturation peptidase HycI [Shewanella dokdonensis]QVK23839.1 hydrogenase maturation peptidase HycI [Shewanella dokdonensis]